MLTTLAYSIKEIVSPFRLARITKNSNQLENSPKKRIGSGEQKSLNMNFLERCGSEQYS